jgi:phospholipase C
MPTQQPASRRHRPIPHQQNANVTVDRSTGSVTPAMTNVGDAAVSMAV